jgi:hypothetical protein
MKLRVNLNGTDLNPFLKMGLKQNPFPQIARREYDGACHHLNVLAAEPIPDTDYIRNHLKGWSKEFVDLCCAKYEKGKYVTFTVEWSDKDY